MRLRATARSVSNNAVTDAPRQVPSGQTAPEWKPWRPLAGQDFYHLVARLGDGDQRMWTASKAVSSCRTSESSSPGPKLNFRDNYLRFGQRPLFLFGTDDWGYVFNTTRETPLQWLRDMRQRRDLGVMIYENLQFGLPRVRRAHQEQLLAQSGRRRATRPEIRPGLFPRLADRLQRGRRRRRTRRPSASIAATSRGATPTCPA